MTVNHAGQRDTNPSLASASDPEATYRIALWTPLPPQKTGVADYVDEMLRYLDGRFDIEIFVEETVTVTPELSSRYQIYRGSSYEARDQAQPFDLNVYQMGNNVFHLYIYEQLLRVPGLVVLHDLSLSSVLYHYYAGQLADIGLFRQEFAYSEGRSALRVANHYINTGDATSLFEFFGEHYMLRRVVERSLALVVHFNYGEKILKERYGAERTHTMYLGSVDPLDDLEIQDKASARKKLGIPPDTFVIGIFGHLQQTKQISVSLRALRRLIGAHDNVLMTLVGEVNPSEGYDDYLNNLIDSLGVENHLRITGFVPKEKFLLYLLAADVQVNLRYPSFGQMSATLSRGIAAGNPIIITDLPEWQFLPESFCWRVDADDRQGYTLENYLKQFIENPHLIEEAGKRAREFFLTQGTMEHAAHALGEMITHTIENVSSDSITTEYELPMTLSDTLKQDPAEHIFEQWINVRSKGSKNPLFKSIRKIPIVGQLIYGVYRIVIDLFNAREIRRIQLSLYQTLISELSDVKQGQHIIYSGLSDVKQMYSTHVHGIDDRYEELAKKLLTPYELPPSRAIEAPLNDQVEAAKSKLADLAAHEGSEAERFYFALEHVFRGSEETIRARQQRALSYIDITDENRTKPVVDIGCGRGEFLKLLREAGVQAVGVDTNGLNVAYLKKQGFDVRQQDVFDFLASVPDDSLGGVTAFHVIEHLPHERVQALLQLAYQKLAPGGFIYLETPNPYCFESLSSFHTDPSHVQPFQPYQLAFLLAYYGYVEPKLIFSEPVPAHGTQAEDWWQRLYLDFAAMALKPEA